MGRLTAAVEAQVRRPIGPIDCAVTRSSGGLHMTRCIIPAVLCLLAPAWALADAIEGTITDSSGAAVPNAQVGLFSRVGLVVRRVTDRTGGFRLDAPVNDESRIVITANGFATKSVALPAASPLRIELEIAPVSDSIGVAGSTM